MQERINVHVIDVYIRLSTNTNTHTAINIHGETECWLIDHLFTSGRLPQPLIYHINYKTQPLIYHINYKTQPLIYHINYKTQPRPFTNTNLRDAHTCLECFFDQLLSSRMHHSLGNTLTALALKMGVHMEYKANGYHSLLVGVLNWKCLL